MKCKKPISVSLIATFLVSLLFDVNAQEAVTRFPVIYPSFGVAFGFFYPEDVNKYIEEDILANYTDPVNTDIYMYYEAKGGVTLRLKNADFSAFFEYNIAPKIIIVTNGNNLSYGYSHMAPELAANYYIPNRSGRHALILGAGLSYSMMKFKEFKASGPGFKIQVGYSLQFNNLNLQPYGALRYVNATDNSSYSWSTEDRDFNLNYTGFQVGVILSFHKVMLYK